MSAPAGSTSSISAFHGPRCWAVSVIVGAMLGFLLAWIAPAPPPEEPVPESPSAPHVVQVGSDGSRVHRLPDGSVEPASDHPAPSIATTAPAAAHPSPHHGVPLWLCAPFALLLLSIALMPFVSQPFWHHHFPDFAFFFGSIVLVYYLQTFGAVGRHEMLHVGIEYYSFIALVGGLYVASSGVLIDIRERDGRSTPFHNTLLLAIGCVLANILGTTGASVLLIRPFMRMNRGRLRPVHVVFFIFIVANCAGALTPIGDPPLYLGYLRGVPFQWTLLHMWPMWLMVNGLLLAAFYIVDRRIPAPVHSPTAAPIRPRPPVIIGWPCALFLGLLVAGVFVDPLLRKLHVESAEGLPLGATFQVAMALCAYLFSRPSIHRSNQFTFEPVKEVGILFVGIFLTMAPALAYLGTHAATLGLETPTQFYFFTGSLSGVLDNAPTYISFLQVALGTLHVPMYPEGVRQFIDSSYELSHIALASGAAPDAAILFHGQTLLEAIALGSVFFGALTYIGNGPNFMVKSIVDAAHVHSRQNPAPVPGNELGTKMPSFFGYILYAAVILLPVLLVNWFVFIR